MMVLLKKITKRVKQIWKEYATTDNLNKFKVILEILIAIIGCWFAYMQTKINEKQEEIALRQTQPEIVLDITKESNDYIIEFTALQGIVYNAKVNTYSCVLATVYDFSSVEFESYDDEYNFNPNETMFDGSEYIERTIVLPIRSTGTYSGQLIGNSTRKNDSLMSIKLYSNSMKIISECANFNVPVDDSNKHWVCFSEAGVFIKLTYQDIYGNRHNDYYLLVPKLEYQGLYRLNDKMGDYIFDDCYSVMGKVSSVDCLPVGDIDLDVFNITDEIAKREIQARYKRYLKFSEENIIPVFYTYIND